MRGETAGRCRLLNLRLACCHRCLHCCTHATIFSTLLSMSSIVLLGRY